MNYKKQDYKKRNALFFNSAFFNEKIYKTGKKENGKTVKVRFPVVNTRGILYLQKKKEMGWQLNKVLSLL